MVNDFLFELGCEELPSGAVQPLGEALATLISDALKKAQLSFTSLKYFATPRRLAILITGLPDEQPSQQSVKRGPAIAAAYDAEGQPSRALQGFAKSCGAEISELTVSKTEKGEWLVYEQVVSGVKTREILPGLIKQSLASLPISKPMRWGDVDYEFARPVHWIVMLLGKEVLPGEFFGLSSQRYTFGHRFHAPAALEITDPVHYESLLHDASVIADFSKRRELVLKQIEQVASTYQAQALIPETLIDEVTSIVEWPETLAANFEPDFLDVPAEALIASMQAHQKCFALQDKQGQLLPHFLTVSNLRSKNPEQVIEGNEKVMRARLSDASFFFHQDKKHPLSYHIKSTGQVVFQNKLGTLLDKTTRMKALMSYLAPILQLEPEQAIRVTELSKCDLMTGMVGEFPELQGLMGYYYAKHDGESPEVAIALQEQYLPRFAADDLPTSSLGLAISLADRLDTLVGIFAIGQKPGGDKDPFKLRRHALAVVRLLMSTSKPLNLSELITKTAATYQSQFHPDEKAIAELQPFILERLQSYYQAAGVSQDIVQAVRACQSNGLFDFDKRVKALTHFVTLPEAGALSAACKRVNNLLQHGFDIQLMGQVKEDLLTEAAERELFTTMNSIEQEVLSLYDQGDYTLILTRLASLRKSVDAFFDNVMVMVDDSAVKTNRLSLLYRLQQLLQGTADISLLQLA